MICDFGVLLVAKLKEMILKVLKYSFVKKIWHKKICASLLFGFIWLMAGHGIIFGANPVDSLHDQLVISQTDAERLVIYQELGRSLQLQNPDSSSFYFEKALKVAKNLSNSVVIASIMSDLGYNYWEMGKFKEAEDLLRMALNHFLQLNDKQNYASTLRTLGNVYWKKGSLKQAMSHFFEAIKIAEELDNKKIIAQMYNDIANVHWDLGDMKLSLYYDKKAFTIREQLGNKQEMAESLNNLGITYLNLKNYEKSLEYYERCYEICEEINFSSLLSLVGGNLGEVYMELGNFKKANYYFKKALTLSREIKNIPTEALILANMAKSLIIQEKYWEAIKYSKEVIELSKANNLLKAQKEGYEYMSICYEELGEFKNAVEYYEEFKRLDDSVFNEVSSKQIIEMQTKYDADTKVRENNILKKDIEFQQLKIRKETNFRNFLLVITILVLALSFLLYNKMQSKKKNQLLLENKVKIRTRELNIAKEKAEENDRLKTAFLANVSHEVRTPMNGIMDFSELLKRPQLTGEKKKEYINKIENSGERMLTIINNLVDISKLESGQMEMSKDKLIVKKELQMIYDLYEEEIKNKGLEFKLFYPHGCNDLILNTDRGKFNAIFSNLLNNAIKFTLNGTITIGGKLKGEYVEFFVKDTGIGIANEMKDLVFERYIQADIAKEKQYDGAGLGLSISKAFVELLGGKIWVKSKYWEGSVFYFTLPILNSSEGTLNNNEIELSQVA